MEGNNNRDSKGTFLLFKASQTAAEVSTKLEMAINLGYAVLLENISEEIDSLYEPILQKKLIKQGSSYKMKFADNKEIDYNTDFKFYLTTKLPKPHYPPEICVKVTLLNFEVTQEGLEDQMLNLIILIEEPLKEQSRQRSIEEFYANKERLKFTEDKILRLLYEAKGDLLDNDELTETL